MRLTAKIDFTLHMLELFSHRKCNVALSSFYLFLKLSSGPPSALTSNHTAVRNRNYQTDREKFK